MWAALLEHFPAQLPQHRLLWEQQARLGAAAFTTANSFILSTKHLQLNTMKKKSSCCLEGDRLEKCLEGDKLDKCPAPVAKPRDQPGAHTPYRHTVGKTEAAFARMLLCRTGRAVPLLTQLGKVCCRKKEDFVHNSPLLNASEVSMAGTSTSETLTTLSFYHFRGNAVITLKGWKIRAQKNLR